MAKQPTHDIGHVDPKHVLWFVYGAVADWNQDAQLNAVALAKYQQETLAKVNAYMRGEVILDGSFSDLQVVVATEAKFVFKPTPIGELWKVEARRLMRLGQTQAAVDHCRQKTGMGPMHAGIACAALVNDQGV